VSQTRGSRKQKLISVRSAHHVLRVFWPDFVDVDGCVFAAFQWSGSAQAPSGDKTSWECFVNHTHLLDEFKNTATMERRKPASENLDEVEVFYDHTHPDFVAACEQGIKVARMWATKLKLDYPQQRFRVYYTQYDNPILRFHKVRTDEPVWLSDEALLSATDPSFSGAVIYDTDYLDRPVAKCARTVLQ